MQLHLMTWQDVESYLQHSKGIIIPIGSTEQHGPNGLLGTDVICPEEIAKRMGAEDDVLIAPTFNVGCAQHHMAFAGTITLRPSTMMAAIMDWVNSLYKHGFTHFYFLNGHGGNVPTINAAFAEIYAQWSLDANDPSGAPLTCYLQNWWELPGIFDLCNKMFPQGHGAHATPSEVSLTYYAYPEAVKDVTMTPKIAPNGPIKDAEDYKRRFPDGRIGSDPSLATVELGEKIMDASVKSLSKSYKAFLNAR